MSTRRGLSLRPGLTAAENVVPPLELYSMRMRRARRLAQETLCEADLDGCGARFPGGAG
jgi:hypothetical protein